MKKSLKDTLLLKPKVDIKKSEINLNATEKAVAKIHQAEIQTAFGSVNVKQQEPDPSPVVVTPINAPKPEITAPLPSIAPRTSVVPARKNAKNSVAAPPNQKEVEQERTKRVTLDIPISLHTAIKMKTFRQSITIREYLLGLAAKDL
jgi:hypothetical protein